MNDISEVKSLSHAKAAETSHDERLGMLDSGAITRAQISDLVDRFYDRVWAHAELGPIFSSRLDHKRDQHLATMKKFWASVLLASGEYHGRPVPKHKVLHDVREYHFGQWLGLFQQTANEVFCAETAVFVTTKAERIAQSLWLAMFGQIGETPPTWIGQPHSENSKTSKSTEGLGQ